MSPSYLASGTLKSVLSLCLALSTTIPSVLSAPTQAETSSPWIPRSLKSLFEPRAATCNGVGVLLTNSGATKSFSFWTNNPNDSRTMLKTVTINSGDTQFVPLESGWAGTVQRGEFLPATWVELNMVGTAWGDVSLQQGCDGGATLSSTTDGTSQGFSENINDNADIPASAYFNPATQGTQCYGSGQCTTSATNVLDTTTGNYWAPQAANAASTNYIIGQLGGQTEALQKAFIGTNDWNTTPQVTSSNNCMAVTFF
ncbi:MAG: hypothetical protein Q9161_005430 [Pseudevernia consocians]